MNISFSERVVVVAGGTGGLGKAVSLAFLEEDAKVIVTYRKEEAFRALKDAACPKQYFLVGSQVDVPDEAAVVPFINRVLTQFAPLDALVNTVGGYVGGVKLWEMTTK